MKFKSSNEGLVETLKRDPEYIRGITRILDRYIDNKDDIDVKSDPSSSNSQIDIENQPKGIIMNEAEV